MPAVEWVGVTTVEREKAELRTKAQAACCEARAVERIRPVAAWATMGRRVWRGGGGSVGERRWYEKGGQEPKEGARARESTKDRAKSNGAATVQVGQLKAMFKPEQPGNTRIRRGKRKMTNPLRAEAGQWVLDD